MQDDSASENRINLSDLEIKQTKYPAKVTVDAKVQWICAYFMWKSQNETPDNILLIALRYFS